MNTENCKTNKTNKFVLNVPEKADLKNSDKYVALQHLYVIRRNMQHTSTIN